MLSKRVLNIAPSATVALVGRVAEMQSQGIDVITFGLGEPDFKTPDNVGEAAKRAIDAGLTKYTTVSGILPLRQGICKKLKEDNNVEYEPSEISVGTGAKQPLFNAVQALVDEGDEVLLPTPCWVSYVEMIKIAGGVPVPVPSIESEGFALDLKALEAAITPKTKVILLNTPNNPTGAVYSEESLRALAKMACEHDFYIIADEVYEKLTYNGKKHFSVASISREVRDRTVLINGFSKAYAMTGWRMGYAASNKEIIKAINAYQGHCTSNPSSIVQYACIEALNGPQDSLEIMRQEFDRRRLFLLDRLNSIEGVTCVGTEGAFYLMPNISSFYGKSYGDVTIHTSTDMAEFLLDNAHVAVVPGDAFLIPDNLRISYSTSMEKLTTGMDRIEKALALLH